MKNGCEFRNTCPYRGELFKCNKLNSEKDMNTAISQCAQKISEIMLRQPSREDQIKRDATDNVKLGGIKPGFTRSLNVFIPDMEDREPQDPRFVEPEKSDLDL